MADLVTIKKIKTAAGEHDIDAKYWDGHSFSAVESMIHGIVDTYVIPTSKSGVSGYTKIVGVTDNTITIKQSELNNLVAVQPSDSNKSYKVGDVILIEEASTDSKFVFDRWVSAVGTESDPTISLTVLETQVATHHHTFGVTTSKALTGVASSPSTATIPTVGSAVTVLTGTSGDVVTSVSYDDKGDYDLALSSASSTDEGSVGHSHTISSHSHNITFKPSTLVSRSVDVYTSLSTDSYTPHTHTTQDVAGVATADGNLTYATGGGSKETFIKTLKDSSLNTGSANPATGTNTSGTSTTTQTSKDSVGEIVKTTESGSHTHNISSAETANVVTSVVIASKVITGVTASNNTSVASNVVTGITYASTKVATGVERTVTSASFLNSCSVDDNGVLSFGVSKALTDVTVTCTSTNIGSVTSHSTATQSAAAPTITLTSVSQEVSVGKVAVSGTIESAGAHKHGFSHTHSIPEHTHTVESHTHSYNKSVADAKADAYVSLSTSTQALHKHESATVVGATNNESPFTYVTDGSTTSVVRDMIDVDKTYTTTSVSTNTDTKYMKLTGDITFPGLKVDKKTISTTTVTPAVAGTETAIKSITFTSANFVTGIKVGDDIKTSENKGGK